MSRALRAIVAVVAALAAIALQGCAGARIDISAERSRYPLSMSGAVRDASGHLLDRSMVQKVGDLSASRTRIGIVYSAVTPYDVYDISDDVNAQVGAVGGEAVMDLTVTVSTGCNVLNGFPVLSILPFWPGCIPVHITGAIVRRLPTVTNWSSSSLPSTAEPR